VRSAFAVFLRGFTLPFGVVTGRRIVLDGDIGDIKFYDSLDDLRLRMGWPGNPDAIYFYLPDSALFPTGENRAGRISGTTVFIGSPAARGALEIVSPDLVTAGRDRMVLELVCEANDGTQPPRADFYSDPSFARGDIRLDARSIARGLLAGGRYYNTAADDVARAAGVNTDMAVTVAVVAGQAYEVTLNSHFTVGTAGANYGVDLWDGAATVGRFERRNPADTPAGSLLHYAGNTVEYFPTVTGNVTLTVRNAAGSGGTILMNRSTPGYRSLTAKHVGQV
jgi:hypothetical protein